MIQNHISIDKQTEPPDIPPKQNPGCEIEAACQTKMAVQELTTVDFFAFSILILVA